MNSRAGSTTALDPDVIAWRDAFIAANKRLPDYLPAYRGGWFVWIKQPRRTGWPRKALNVAHKDRKSSGESEGAMEMKDENGSPQTADDIYVEANGLSVERFERDNKQPSHPLHDPADPATSWALNPWMPMTRPLDLKHLGKLGEEVCEAGAAIFRCIIQGIEESEPVTGKPNREWLEDEIADALANIDLVCEHFSLDAARIQRRIDRKKTHLRGWHSMLEDGK